MSQESGPSTAAATAASAASLFTATFGAAPEGVWSAPGRVNLIGEHTDYNAGLCLPIALPHRTYAAVSPRADRRLRLVSAQGDGMVEVSLDEVAPGRPGGWAAYVAGVPWALARGGYSVEGLDVAVDGGVPLGAGLSSSAALECAVAAAVSDLSQLGLLESPAGRASLAAACMEAENTIAQAPTGGMDQSAALLCAPGHALLLDCRDHHTEAVPFDLQSQALGLLVIDTRAEHALVDGQYAERRASCERAARELGVSTLREVGTADLDDRLGTLSDPLLRRRARHVVTEIARVEQAVAALRAGDFATLGQLFLRSHASMRDDFEISVPELDTAVEASTEAGALGARMTGGGFGGSAIALVEAAHAEAVRAQVAQAFQDSGFRPPQSFLVSAQGGAVRDA